MNLRQLETFVAVADCQSFSKAANRLFLTQPTVSAHVVSLEKELNVRLFHRNTKEVHLSADGEKLYQYACQMIRLQRKIEELFLPEQAQHERQLRIAASSIPSQYLLPEILAAFQEKYPDTMFKLLEADSEAVIRNITEHIVEIGFTGMQPENKVCHAIPFYRDELVILMPSSERYQRILQEEHTLDWLRQVPVIMREEGSGTRREAERWLRKEGILPEELHVVANVANAETIKKSVKNGIGVTVISRLAVQEDLEAGTVLEFPISERNRRWIYLVYHRDFPLSAAAKRLVRIVQEKYPGA